MPGNSVDDDVAGVTTAVNELDKISVTKYDDNVKRQRKQRQQLVSVTTSSVNEHWSKKQNKTKERCAMKEEEEEQIVAPNYGL